MKKFNKNWKNEIVFNALLWLIPVVVITCFIIKIDNVLFETIVLYPSILYLIWAFIDCVFIDDKYELPRSK